MDGEAVCTALASCPGPDCLKDIVKKCGPRLRVYKAFRVVCLEAEVSYKIVKRIANDLLVDNCVSHYK